MRNIALNTNKNLEYYLHPIEIKLRDRYLQIVSQHGNGLWAFNTLEWEVYESNANKYEVLNEEEKYILNMYMKALKCLYK